MRWSKKDVRVLLLFDEMLFDPSLMLCAMCFSWKVEITSCQMWFRVSKSLSFQNLFLFLKKVIKQLWPHYFDARLIFLNFLVQRQCIFVLWRVIRSKPQTNKAKWLIYFATNSILRRSLGTRPFCVHLVNCILGASRV